MAMIVQRHGIEKGEDISAFQHRLIHDEKKVRIASAPTGTGKSFAYIKAVNLGKRVLFIVPTRILAKNLIKSLEIDLKMQGWDDHKIDSKISLWSSDVTRELKEKGVENIAQKKYADAICLSLADGGEFIVATPESVAGLYFDPKAYPVAGMTDQSVLKLLESFDHIVFDEMHTISAVGLSQSFMLSYLASFYSKAKPPAKISNITFLSATPVNIFDNLIDFGLEEDAISIIDADIVTLPVYGDVGDKYRVLHGNVTIHTHENIPLYKLVSLYAEQALLEVEKGNSIVLIYDRVYEGLQSELDELAELLDRFGINKEERLLINSIDSNQSGKVSSDKFVSGPHDPTGFKVLVCSSSVEVGVTLKTNIVLSESGHSALSLLQREGRVARGDMDGLFVISYRTNDLFSKPWLKTFINFYNQHNNNYIDVESIYANLSKDFTHKFINKAKGMFGITYFDSMSNRAQHIAGLAYVLLLQHNGVKNAKYRLMQDAMPPLAKEMHYQLNLINVLGKNSLFKKSVANWLSALNQAVRNYRSIGKQIMVINPDGISVPHDFDKLKRFTTILDTFGFVENSKGQLSVEISAQSWKAYIRDKAIAYKSEQYVLFCDQQASVLLNKHIYELSKEYVEQKKRNAYNQAHTKALEAMNMIIGKTHLLCLVEE